MGSRTTASCQWRDSPTCLASSPALEYPPPPHHHHHHHHHHNHLHGKDPPESHIAHFPESLTFLNPTSQTYIRLVLAGLRLNLWKQSFYQHPQKHQLNVSLMAVWHDSLTTLICSRANYKYSHI